MNAYERKEKNMNQHRQESCWDAPFFLRTADLPKVSGLSMKAIRRILREHGVQPVGGPRSLHWSRDLVIETLRTINAEAQAAVAESKPVRPAKHLVLGRSVDSLHAALEASNGN